MEYINLNNLRSFFYVAKFSSFSIAARELSIQQPALSKNVKSLEEELDVRLYARVGRGIELTDEGRYIFARASEIFDQVGQIIRYSKNQDIPLKESVQIACSDVIASMVAPSILRDLSDKFPSMRPVVSTGKVQELLSLIKEGKVSGGAFFHLPKKMSGVTVVSRVAVEFKLVIGSAYQHSHKVRTSFIGSREVDDPENIKFPTVERMKNYWPDTQIRYSSNSLMGHLEMVKAGLGVAILPNFLVREELRLGVLKEVLPDEEFIFDLKIVKRSKGEMSEYAVDFFKRIAKEVL